MLREVVISGVNYKVIERRWGVRTKDYLYEGRLIKRSNRKLSTKELIELLKETA